MRLVHIVFGMLSVFWPLNSVLAEGSEYPALLGNGYDSLKLEHKMSQCVEGSFIEKVHIEYDAEFTKVENWSSLQAQMNFRVPGSIVLSSDSELAKFVLRARDTQFTSTYILQNHVSVRQKMITNPKIPENHQDPKTFRNECGTQYISMVTNGGKLHVGIKFSFSDFEFKQEFDAGGAIQSLTGLGAHVDSLSSSAKQNSSVEIFFHQVGGNLLDLNDMFESGDIISCSLEHFDKCENLLRAVWDYSKDKFAKSVLEGRDQTISYRTVDYPNAPHFYEDAQVKKERGRLIDALELQHYERDFLNSLKGERLEEYEDCDNRCLTRLLSDVQANMRALKENIVLSFENSDLFKAEKISLESLQLIEIKLPTKKWNYQTYLMDHIHYIVPSTVGLVSLITVPIIWSYNVQRQKAKVN
jgi:hypothetical protein